MYIGEIIKKYRTDHGLSQRQFAKKTSLSPSYINTLEKIYNPKNNKPYSVTTDVALELAKAMSININDLLNMLDPRQEFIVNSTEEINYDIETKQTYPILGTVKAGYDYLAQENYIGYVTMDKNVVDPENYYALRVTGDSMQPILNNNDIVIVHQQYDVESGQVAIVLLNDEEATIKKVIKHEKNIELVAFNSYYPSKIVEDYKIIGRVVEARISKVFE